MHTDQLLSPEAAAQRLGVSTNTFLRWLRDGRISSYRCGRKTIRVRWDEVLDALRSDEGSASVKPASSRPGVSP